ncbi:hypothetical protein CLM62_03470 [Streptomyces sp. SA15]|uniref:hypothetical protein n=1 Tax=Streptomyces sp. SA15 TaxID=934019 RepID=UPI000BAEC950|nr:hypothetical protein [Streptomyces sp. SA15]PAZ17242.1 hypothetical protein CLM62_03470 [Streptomyces sp. SA15]
MRKYQKAAVVVAMLGSVSFLGAGVGHAGGSQNCQMNDDHEGIIYLDDLGVNVNVLLAHGDQDYSEREIMNCKNGH